MSRELEFRCGRRPVDDGDVVHLFGVPYRLGRAGPRSRAVLWAALERAWERGDGVGVIDLDEHDAAARLDAGEADGSEV